ncbi:MAG TPA: PP2C family serine/threonine-protein phosphatase [Microbacteriaceae bacterium]|nr:PP2C family serine/threonine-protein phosphatase [Microbacteriaceae bacterium]
MVSIKASATVSHVGKVRATNQDSGYAGSRVFAVADGMGGHAGGDVASAIAMQRIADLDREFDSAQAAAEAMAAAITEVNTHIGATVAEHRELTGMGTTFTAVSLCGDTMVVSHIGDSRLYLLRAGELAQITTDHTFVQRLVDAGRITEDEARTHPRRSVLMRVLGDVESQPDIDSLLLQAHDGDRWMLCSDGLSGVVPFDDLKDILSSSDGVKPAADRLMRAALDGGAPDNVTVIVIDIGEPPAPNRQPLLVGSAANPISFQLPEPTRARPLRLPTFRTGAVHEAHFEPENSAYLDELIAEDLRRERRRRWIWVSGIALLLATLGLLGSAAYQWTQSRFFVGENAGVVVIYQGIQQNIGPITLHHPVETTSVKVGKLSAYDQKLLEATISADSLLEARAIVDRLRDDVTGGTP